MEELVFPPNLLPTLQRELLPANITKRVSVLTVNLCNLKGQKVKVLRVREVGCDNHLVLIDTINGKLAEVQVGDIGWITFKHGSQLGGYWEYTNERVDL